MIKKRTKHTVNIGLIVIMGFITLLALYVVSTMVYFRLNYGYWALPDVIEVWLHCKDVPRGWQCL